MSLTNNIIANLTEKACIDWNNYLTPEEVKDFLSKDDKVESAENIIRSDDFKPRYQDLHNDLQAKYNNSWTKDELIHDLVDFYNHGNLITESNYIDKDKKAFELWKSQIENKSDEDKTKYLGKLYKDLANYNKTNSNIRSNDFYKLLDKIEFVESKLGIKRKIGRVLH